MADADRRGVFISWSKSTAGEIARHLEPFLEDVLGTARIFMSQTMEGGTRWSMEIPQRLQECNAGLVLVTTQNSHEPWLHFEAGALSKHIDESRVVPLLCGGASVGNIQGTPLSLFQSKTLDHDDFLSICVSFGSAFEISEDAVRRRFEKSWPDLEAAVNSAGKLGTPVARNLDFPDLMAVLERIAGQVTAIESVLRVTEPPPIPARGGMFGGSVNYPGKVSKLADLLQPSSDELIAQAYLPELRLMMEQIAKKQAEEAKGHAATSKGLSSASKKGSNSENRDGAD